MAGLDVLGGIGKGLMQGSQFIHEARRADEAKQLRQQQIEMQKQQLQMQGEQHQWKADEQKRLAADRERLQGYQTLSQTIDTEYSELSPAQRNAMKLKYGHETGLIAHDEFQKLQAAAQQFEREGLMSDLISGNSQGIAAKFSQKLGRPISVDVQQGKSGNTYRLTGDDGSVLRELNDEQIGMLLGMKELADLGEIGRKDEKHAAYLNQTQSAIQRNQAQAGAASALAQQRRTAPPASGPKPYTPASEKTAAYWRSAPPDQVEAEVDRQLSSLRARVPADSYEREVLDKPEVVEQLKADIRGKLGVQSAAPAKPDAPTNRNLDSYFR